MKVETASSLKRIIISSSSTKRVITAADFWITEPRGAGPGRGPGLGVVSQTMFGSEPGSNDSKSNFLEHFGLSGPFLFRGEKVIRSCAHLMLVTQSGSGNKSHRLDFLGDFRSCPLPEIVRDNKLQT
jgi:hypothetical protein